MRRPYIRVQCIGSIAGNTVEKRGQSRVFTNIRNSGGVPPPPPYLCEMKDLPRRCYYINGTGPHFRRYEPWAQKYPQPMSTGHDQQAPF